MISRDTSSDALEMELCVYTVRCRKERQSKYICFCCFVDFIFYFQLNFVSIDEAKIEDEFDLAALDVSWD